MTELKQKKSEQVSTRLSPNEAKQIEKLVSMGFYMNEADFIRQAVREKLESVEVLSVRNISKKKAKEEIIKYIKEHGRSYPSDMADALEIDVGLVISVVKSLIKEGRVR